MLLPDPQVRLRDYLLQIARAMTQELNLEKLLEQVLTLAARLVAGQAGIVILRDPDGSWRVTSSIGINPEFIKYFDPLLAQVPNHEDPARFELPEINRLLRDLTHSVSMGLLAGVWMPLITRRRVMGVIFIFRTRMIQFQYSERVDIDGQNDRGRVLGLPGPPD